MDIKIPEIGESIQEAVVGKWLKKTGDQVERDDLLLELETDKINLEINAEQAGVLEIIVAEGTTAAVGRVIGRIQAGGSVVTDSDDTDDADDTGVKETASQPVTEPGSGAVAVNPAAAQLAVQQGLDLNQVAGSGHRGRIVVDDVVQALPSVDDRTEPHSDKGQDSCGMTPDLTTASVGAPALTRVHEELTRRVPMTAIRKRIAEQLLRARQQTAMVTTFNDIDMTQVLALRQRQQQWFTQKHGVPLGLLSFFVKACVAALQDYPEVNARIDGDDIVYHDFVDMGIAVGTSRGLVVPVVRHVEHRHFFEIEQAITDLANRAESGKLKLQELQGGTFTLSNGGVYGSLLSTPLLNPPQSATMGMHRIEDRAVVRDQQVVIRPMMNVALSYDHRLIDGRQAVGFLKQVKELLETPDELLLEN